MTPYTRPLLLALVALLAQHVLRSSDVNAQDRIRISQDERCSECQISVREVIALATADGPGALTGAPRDVKRDSKGNYYLIEFGIKSVVKRYNAHGRFVDDLGRAGGGPGEFEGISALVIGEADSIFVFDALQNRISVLAPSGAYVRSVRIQGHSDQAIRLSRDRWLISGQVPSPQSIGFPLHLFEGGRLIRSFGGDGAFRPDTPVWDGRRVALDPVRGVIWALHRYQHAFDAWLADGSLRGRYVRSNDWFPLELYNRAWSASRPRPPLNVALTVLPEDGSLLTVTSVAHPEWKERLGEPMIRNGRAVYAGRPGLYAARIEWIDPRRRELRRSTLTEYPIVGHVGGNLFWAEDVDEYDRPTVRIIQVDVRPRDPSHPR